MAPANLTPPSGNVPDIQSPLIDSRYRMPGTRSASNHAVCLPVAALPAILHLW